MNPAPEQRRVETIPPIFNSPETAANGVEQRNPDATVRSTDTTETAPAEAATSADFPVLAPDIKSDPSEPQTETYLRQMQEMGGPETFLNKLVAGDMDGGEEEGMDMINAAATEHQGGVH